MRGIPIKITGGFFITAALIGFINSFSFFGTIIWIGIIFISVLVHELGHALTAKMFGQSPRIELIAFGGLTIPEGPKLKRWKEFIVVFMGPLFGFMLFVLATFAKLLPIANPSFQAILEMFRFVNLFWTFVNLLPILPLDGGQLVRIVLESIMGAKAWKASLYSSLFFATFLCMAFFVLGYYLIGAIFLMFAFQSFETIRRFGAYSEADQSDDNRVLLRQAEVLLKVGRSQEAIPKLEFLRKKTQKGLIYLLASEYLAKIYNDSNNFQAAYQILTQIDSQISKEAKCILYQAAFEVGDYKRAVTLSGVCFQEKQTLDVAVRAAASHAMLGDSQKTIEWLKTAKTFGNVDLKEITNSSNFDRVREDQSFQSFLIAQKNG